jgi:hypothetical protein
VVVDGAPLAEGVDVAGMVVLDVVVPPPDHYRRCRRL